jgi:tetratricopeptide (TPR) repeat protein
MTAEMLWCRIANKSLLGQTEQMLPVYEKLQKRLQNNELFLYNYAAELNVVKQYDKSLAIAHACERFWADYDLQMLMADNYRKKLQYKEAEQHYIKISLMCPVKFMPLYQLAELYMETGQKKKAVTFAQQIVDKEVKIPSTTVSTIKQKMRQLIEKSEAEKVNETCVPASESRMSEQPNNKQTRQGEMPEVKSSGNALPP